MKTITLTAALLAALSLSARAGTEMSDSKDMKQMSSPMASDAGFYVAAYGGANFSTDYGDRRTVASLGGSNFGVTPANVHSDIGGVGGLKAGYNFESFAVCSALRLQPAVEVEGLYIGMRSKAYASGYGSFGLAGSGVDTTTYNNAAGFVNGIIRFKVHRRSLQPFRSLHRGWRGRGICDLPHRLGPE